MKEISAELKAVRTSVDENIIEELEIAIDT